MQLVLLFQGKYIFFFNNVEWLGLSELPNKFNLVIISFILLLGSYRAKRQGGAQRPFLNCLQIKVWIYMTKAFEICCSESQKLKFSNFLAFNREVADFIYCCSIFPINAKEKKKMILVEQSLSAQLGFFWKGKLSN